MGNIIRSYSNRILTRVDGWLGADAECDVGLKGTPFNGGVAGKKHPPIKYNSRRVKHCVPKHSHTYASKHGVSSKRTRAAGGALHRWSSSTLLKRNTARNRVKWLWKKVLKQQMRLHCVRPADVENAFKFDASFLKNNVVVFDGGEDGNPRLEQRKDIARWKCFSIAEGALKICHPRNNDTGMAYLRDDDVEPSFILLPRNDSIGINKTGDDIVRSMKSVMKKQKHLKRGKSKQVFSEDKYCCVGSKPRRSAPGVEAGHYNLKDGIDNIDWDELVRTIRRGEKSFEMFAGTNAIRSIREAREVVDWERAKASDGSMCGVFNGVAFGVNVYLRAHVDHDFTYSVIQVHVEGLKYSADDAVACYFCFPELGIAVPMKPGDFLLINALEYHCVSSRCSNDLDVFTLSCYLKTAVVGGNDNKRKLTLIEEDCARRYEEVLRSSKRRRG